MRLRLEDDHITVWPDRPLAPRSTGPVAGDAAASRSHAAETPVTPSAEPVLDAEPPADSDPHARWRPKADRS